MPQVSCRSFPQIFLQTYPTLLPLEIPRLACSSFSKPDGYVGYVLRLLSCECRWARHEHGISEMSLGIFIHWWFKHCCRLEAVCPSSFRYQAQIQYIKLCVAIFCWQIVCITLDLVFHSKMVTSHRLHRLRQYMQYDMLLEHRQVLLPFCKSAASITSGFRIHKQKSVIAIKEDKDWGVFGFTLSHLPVFIGYLDISCVSDLVSHPVPFPFKRWTWSYLPLNSIVETILDTTCRTRKRESNLEAGLGIWGTDLDSHGSWIACCWSSFQRFWRERNW